MKEGKRKKSPPQMQNQDAYSWWMMTRTEGTRQTPEVLEFRRKTIVTNTLRPFQESVHHLMDYH